MAALYGSVQGNRGEATREGSKESGIKAWVQTWSARITVELEADGRAWVVLGPGPSSGGQSRVLWEGNIEEELRS